MTMDSEDVVGGPVEDNLFVMVAQLAKRLGKGPLQHRLFIHRMNPHWTVVVNGCGIPKGFKEYTIDPGFCFVEYKEWPAGLFTPYGGQFVKNEEASEDIFRGLLKDAIAKARPPEEDNLGPSSPDPASFAPTKDRGHDI